MLKDGKVSGDQAYSAVLTFLPVGLRGLSVAALTAAIVASLAGKANSISTIFTLDIYKRYINTGASERKLIWIGRLAIFVSMLVALAFTWQDSLNIGGEGGFKFIQKYTGFISPGVFAMFLLGMFWKRTTGAAAVAGLLTGFGLSIFFDQLAPVISHENFLYTAYPNGEVVDGKPVYEIPFLICMGWSFAFTVLLMVIISLFGPKESPKAFEIDRSMFKVSPITLTLIVTLLMMLGALYVRFW
jgi:SSS family solute:Na+ symporter